jgi:bacillithiol system protein YtxJ
MTAVIALTTPIEFDRALRESQDRPVVIFKHSPRCSVSAFALGSYRKLAEGAGKDALFAVVDVLEARALSDEIARQTGVRHQTPQAFVLRDGRVVWSGSHWDITDDAIRRALEEARGA